MDGTVRSIDIAGTSIGGSPSTIHWAINDPTPPESRMPSEFSPHAEK